MKALVIVDMQKDFMPGGSLATPNGDELVPLINQMMEVFPLVVATKDWHPKDHASFAIWPIHCVQGTEGAELANGLNVEEIEAIFEKGVDRDVDSYSAFFDNAKKRKTGLDNYLRQRGVESITLVGVATDYCVLYSALDARSLGWDVSVVTDGVRAINLDSRDEERALSKMKAAGVHLISSREVMK